MPPPELPPEEPELPPLCPPEGIEGMLEPPPDAPPPEDELEPPEEPPLEPELPPLGMLELLPPPPDDPPEEPEEPPDEPLEGLGMLGEGMLDEDCCAQPPIRRAEIAPMSVVFAAMTSSRRKVRRWDIALLRFGRSMIERPSLSTRIQQVRSQLGADKEICDGEAERALT